MKQFLLGTSGYNYREWKDDFYPINVRQKDWMAYYASKFTSLEINATFYRSFPAHVYEKWHNTVGDGFTFTIKGPRTITHIKRLKDIDEELSVFYSANAALREKLSCILWQFPSNFKKNERNYPLFQAFLTKLPPKYRHAFEFRDPSWFEDEVYNIMKQHNAGFVINDSNRFPAATAITSDFAYIRFHGPRKLYASSYTDEELKDWSKQIKQWLQTIDVYAYFNNDMGGHAFRNALALRKMIA